MRGPSSDASLRHILDPTVYTLLTTTWPSPVPPGRSVEWVLDHLLIPPSITTLRVNGVDVRTVEDAISTAESLYHPRVVQRHPLLDDVLIITHDSARSEEAPSDHKRWEDPPGKEVSVDGGGDAAVFRVPSSNEKALDTGMRSANGRGAKVAGTHARTATVEEPQAGGGRHGAPTPVDEIGQTQGRLKGKGEESGQYPVILVDRRCGQAVLRGAHVFAKGVLASEPHLKAGERVDVFALPGRLNPSKLAAKPYAPHRKATGALHTDADQCRDGSQTRHNSPGGYQPPLLEDTREAGRKRDCTNGAKPELVISEDLREAECDSARGETHPDGFAEHERLASVLQGTYLRAQLPERVRKTGIFCGRGILRQNMRQVYAEKTGVAIEMDRAVDLSRLPPCLVAQNLPSIVVGHVLAPQPGERVLDMCAAPGGKTLHLATLMKGQGHIVAVERSKTRAQKLRSFLCSSPHASIVEVVCGDSAKGTWRSTHVGAEASPGRRLGNFDRVLADVPCTALGLRPRLDFDGLTDRVVLSAAEYQREFLQSGCQLLKTGGTLVYSTCSISRAENEENVVWALGHLPLVLEPAEPFVGPHTFQSGDALAPLLPPGEAAKLQRFCPSGNTIGFFIAKFRKTGME
ncbi:putative NOL1/NOP2/sun family protein [Neospora caninum Liverpool]|uniref:NOL1/NOP2/sun family protein, putative n=1 Tax=Neospora caninum (strain Liverpool) TaxID=572307 RepID=F0VMF3_NEOCL|nr:putative NOL1/NOP2/sun family protein [Neospora caninum Liverpool]CBZ54899.1 putative NOL1/NOP2/sun family protein [Neospora caninum Liverpool]CEL69620.1 TPA: NOL1/NOP2/sun family protein, putative [Neospora caninum Liverpool]|eukprot:XP_003884927.1 putative NOL1/NOP2/sun family protein [Neospora caninum Liverpool]